MTHVANLPGIFQSKGVFCDRRVRDGKLAAVDIGNAEIKADRYRVPIACGAKGVVADYVPFYFAPRSPMLYRIRCGGVPTYTQGQNDVLYLVSTAQRIAAAGRAFVFTNGHARMAISRAFDDLKHLPEVDWEVMEGQYWNDTQEHPDRKWRRQAEFLVHNFCPINQIEFIAARTQTVANSVRAYVESSGLTLDVRVMFHWYF